VHSTRSTTSLRVLCTVQAAATAAQSGGSLRCAGAATASAAAATAAAAAASGACACMPGAGAAGLGALATAAAPFTGCAHSCRCSSGSDGSSGIVGDVSDDHGAFVASLLAQQAISTGECNSKITQLY
jgi:hypothetical protein